MRARNIKPGFFTNEELVECTPWARLCFIGLWSMADRCGRLEDRPKQIKMKIFPADSIDTLELLDELCGHELVVRYEVDGRQYLYIPGFEKHQTPHYKEQEKYPACPGFNGNGGGANPGPKPDHRPKSPRQAQDKPKTGPVQTPDEPPLNPESLILNPESREEKKATKVAAYTQAFEVFWAEYPKKVKKKYAFSCWKKIKGVDALVIVEAIKAQVAGDHFRGNDGKQYVPNPSTWLNEGQWEDEIKSQTNGDDELPPELR
ncbi:hypothetical protein [Pseudodesulfovibrio sediminis]|uniref:DnaT DNA-binding domain-containing protein n=1 Tax=Pseudodesulfovibrio sediminis TaxID=2810563 RepID=A0ABM7P3F7_9BACT|nr:hypothetical protein [Pseudodesulfovibrio sediminis]BCS87349.1 hypothetical protein PSDVSF_05910 [Pseudodesulfovibrio sediminis]